jgi:pectate lyase
MTSTDTNSSINNLIGTLATINTGSFIPIPTNLVCIDTSNNRLGVNTIDPSYSIHVLGSGDDGTMSSSGLIVSDTMNTRVILKNLPINSAGLDTGQLWNDGGTLKIA